MFKSKMKIDEYNDRRSGSKATIAIAPQVYLGWCWQLPGTSEELWIPNTACNYGVPINGYSKELEAKSTQVTSNYRSIKCFYEGAWWFVSPAALKDYRMNTTDDIVRRLSMMYYEGQSNTLMIFEDLLQDYFAYKSSLATVLRDIDRQTSRAAEGMAKGMAEGMTEGMAEETAEKTAEEK